MKSWTAFANNTDSEYDNSDILSSHGYIDINWLMTNEQVKYYIEQFQKIVPDNSDKLSGSLAKDFFELSKLNVDTLRDIWELADYDKDGSLTLGEFCIAMHLVVLKKSGLNIPKALPNELLQYLKLSAASNHFLKDNNPKDFTIFNTTPYKVLKRLPSNTSLKSDVLSLTEGMTAFDNKPPVGVSYPVPYRPEFWGINEFYQPTGPTKLLLTEEQSAAICNDETDKATGGGDDSGATLKKGSTDIVANNPPVPPRHRSKASGHNNSNSFSTYSDENVYDEPLLENPFGMPQFDIDFSQSPEMIVMKLNAISESDHRKEAYKYLINTLKMHCETLSLRNQEMSQDLKHMQQQRICLELQLEKLMPLNYL